MPRLIRADTLVTRGKQRADMENTTFVADTEWKFHLSTAYAELYSILVASGLRYFERTATLVTKASRATYPLPADFLSGIGLDYLVSATTGERRELVELMAQERNVYAGLTGSAEARAFAYVGPNLVLYPQPPAGQSYEIVYVPQPADLSDVADTDEIDVVTPDGEAFLLWSMAVIARDKEESDITTAMAERERARARVEEWSTLRALNSPRRRIVADELASYRYDAGDWRP